MLTLTLTLILNLSVSLTLTLHPQPGQERCGATNRGIRGRLDAELVASGGAVVGLPVHAPDVAREGQAIRQDHAEGGRRLS